jgi:hypothetical protein
MEALTEMDSAISKYRRTIVVPVRALKRNDRDSMYALLNCYFTGVDRARFDHDLDEKQWTLLILDGIEIVGFTTLMHFECDVDGNRVRVIFSGDTILRPDLWGEHQWLQAWARHVADIVEREIYPPVYWLLLTSSPRVYRFLTTCFREVSPRHGECLSEGVCRLIDSMVRIKYPTEFDPRRQVVRPRFPASVRDEFRQRACSDTDCEHGRFFATINPRFLEGDLLVCLTQLSHANLTALGERVLRR